MFISPSKTLETVEFMSMQSCSSNENESTRSASLFDFNLELEGATDDLSIEGKCYLKTSSGRFVEHYAVLN